MLDLSSYSTGGSQHGPHVPLLEWRSIRALVVFWFVVANITLSHSDLSRTTTLTPATSHLVWKSRPLLHVRIMSCSVGIFSTTGSDDAAAAAVVSSSVLAIPIILVLITHTRTHSFIHTGGGMVQETEWPSTNQKVRSPALPATTLKCP